MEIKNATIVAAEITRADHGVLVIWLRLNYGGTGQAFGGYCHYNPKFEDDSTGKMIWRIMDICDVQTWGDVNGKHIRVKADHTKVHEIGHLLDDKWFNPSQEMV